MPNQRVPGAALTDDEINRICALLRTTKLTHPEIAKRFNTSRNTITEINKLYKIRFYTTVGTKPEFTLNKPRSLNTLPKP